MTNLATNYEQQANEFAELYNLKLSVSQPTYKDHWHDGKMRWVFPCKLSRNGKSYPFKFGQSIAAGKEKPNMYDILSCLQKYDVGSYESFCKEFGYENSKKSYTTYLAVCKEYEGVCRLFEDSETILDELREIN